MFDEEMGRVNGIVNASNLTAVRNAAGKSSDSHLIDSLPPS